MHDLERARQIQRELRDLHIPTAPIISYHVELLDIDGKVLESFSAKSNSYLRNAYNYLAHTLAFPEDQLYVNNWRDGFINQRDISGNYVSDIRTYVIGRPYTTGKCDWGRGTTPDTIDDLNLGIAITGGTKSTTFASSFDSTNRILTTEAKFTGLNNTGGTLQISEMGYFRTVSGVNTYLHIRDVFSPVTVLVGQTFNFTYKSEIAYPL